MGTLFCVYGGFILSHLLASCRRPLRWGKTGHGRPLSRRAIIMTGSAWMSFGIAAFMSIYNPQITPIAIPFSVIVLYLAYLTSGILDDLRQ